MENNSNFEHHILPVSGLYENWFLDYASYVILERAVPQLYDGLKPVQRRILHSMNIMDDGRFHKVANIIGQTMQYHPHGDAAIGDALVNIGQKDLLIDCQGNWGDIRTGDGAAAPRYIEARLSKFAKEISFNDENTIWQISYDGRKKEPVTLPVKFPLLLAQGVEGIAVGLATKIMPHNFNELIDASIAILKGKKPEIYPDFSTGGFCDISNYNEAKRGSKIRVRAKIEIADKKTLLIREIPFGTTTGSIIESIIKANDNNKIKIKKVVDNTAKDVEILIELPPGVNPDVTVEALYAFTACEISINPNTCVIIDNKPHFLSVIDILHQSTNHTLSLLQQELQNKLKHLKEKYLFSSLEKIFIENRIYRDIEECETWELVIQTIDNGLIPFKPDFYRTIVTDDIVKLTEIKIKRISKFDSIKADELMRKTAEEIAETEHHLAHIIDYAIAYFKNLKDKYGKGRERKTQLVTFDTVQARNVIIASEKLYIDREGGFIGTGLKKNEFVCECSPIDLILTVKRDGKYMVNTVSEKTFVGKDIIHVAIWKKDDERMVFNAIYIDALSKVNYAKRFNITSITRDKEYDITKGANGSKLLYFTANPNGESELVQIQLSPACAARNKLFNFDFSSIEIKGRSSQGNTVTKYPIRKITLASKGTSTLGKRKFWYDEIVGKLNNDERGIFLGDFDTDDNIIIIYNSGEYEIRTCDIQHRLEASKILHIAKFIQDETIVSAVYYDGETKEHFIKRFKIETTSLDKPFKFINEHKNSYVEIATTYKSCTIEYKEGAQRELVIQNIDTLIDVKGWKAIGNKLSHKGVFGKIKLNQTLIKATEENIPKVTADTNSNNDENTSPQTDLFGNVH